MIFCPSCQPNRSMTGKIGQKKNSASKEASSINRSKNWKRISPFARTLRRSYLLLAKGKQKSGNSETLGRLDFRTCYYQAITTRRTAYFTWPLRSVRSAAAGSRELNCGRHENRGCCSCWTGDCCCGSRRGRSPRSSSNCRPGTPGPCPK